MFPCQSTSFTGKIVMESKRHLSSKFNSLVGKVDSVQLTIKTKCKISYYQESHDFLLSGKRVATSCKV